MSKIDFSAESYFAKEVRSVLRMVTPSDVLDSMGMPGRMRWEGRRSWREFLSPQEEHAVRMVSMPLHDMSCDAAVRLVKAPATFGVAAQREHSIHAYLQRLVAVRNKFARRAWRRMSAYAC